MRLYSKIKVESSFFSRLVVILFSILTIWAISHTRPSSTPNTSMVLPTMFGQLEVCLSVSIAAILPCFRLVFQSSERILTASQTLHGDGIKVPDSFGLDSVRTDISTLAPLPRKPDHSAASSQDMSGANTTNSGPRISESSLVPSGHTNMSQRPFVV
jgi:hypothetical protein